MKIKLGMGRTNMERFRKYCGGELYDFTGDAGCDFEYVCTDSREADDRTMFIATRGERVDGHDYISGAMQRGCRCILCEYVPQDIEGKKVCFLVVEDSMASFAIAASGYQREYPQRNIAITGSVGKTTTKELIASVLREELSVYSTKGNFNSIIGMPMSLMEASGCCEVAVFEMGMSSFGEIRSMSLASSPDVALIINIGSSHLEYLKSRENIAKAKLEIAEGVKPGGYLLLDGDEPLLENAKEQLKSKELNIFYVSSGENKNADFYASRVNVTETGSSFDLVYGERTIKDIKLSAIGSHFVKDALYACAVGFLFGIDEEKIREGLLKYRPVGYRQNIYEKNEIKIIADCYNAAPESMHAAIDVLDGISCSGKKIAVLGDMKELGSDSERMHREVGKYLCTKADLLVSIGEGGEQICRGALEAGMPKDKVFNFCGENAGNSAADCIETFLNPGDLILFKASRVMELEKIMAKLGIG